MKCIHDIFQYMNKHIIVRDTPETLMSVCLFVHRGKQRVLAMFGKIVRRREQKLFVDLLLFV